MGEEGFSSDSSPALPPQHPLDHRGRPRVGASATWRRPRTTRWCRATSSCTTCSPPRSSRRPTSSPAGGSCSATATCGSRTPWPARPARGTATASATSASTSSAARARVETVFGAFEVGEGDYVIIPRATTHRWIPEALGQGPAARLLHRGQQPHRAAEALPVSKYGQLLEHAPYCERDLRAAAGPAARRGRRRERRRRDRGLHQAPRATGRGRRHRRHGAHAALPPARRRRLGRLPLPLRLQRRATSSRSPAASTSRRPCTRSSRAGTSSICNFVPRKVDYHPLSIPVPYYHSNVDSDEIMFYVDGDYEARKGSGIGRGSISRAPGRARPRPAAGRGGGARSAWSTSTSSAVMVDTFRPLELGEGGLAVDDGKYAWSWGGGPAHRAPAAATTPSADARAHDGSASENPFRHRWSHPCTTRCRLVCRRSAGAPTARLPPLPAPRHTAPDWRQRVRQVHHRHHRPGLGRALAARDARAGRRRRRQRSLSRDARPARRRRRRRAGPAAPGRTG